MIMGISENDQYITLVEKKNKDLYQLNVINLNTLQTKLEFEYKYYRRECWPLIHFNANDTIAYRINQK